MKRSEKQAQEETAKIKVEARGRARQWSASIYREVSLHHLDLMYESILRELMEKHDQA